ncbi:MAG TPA: hypothetical protein VHE37_05250, partial [Nevskiaceae bacterium]|nr:hypothetical protein [Nevskiaceae bacterium]
MRPALPPRVRAAVTGALSFRTQLLLFAAALMLPVGAVTAWLAYTDFRNDIAAGRESTRGLARLAAAQYDFFLRVTDERLRRLAQRPRVAAADPARCDPVGTELIALQPAYLNLWTLLPDGRIACSALPVPRDSGPTLAQQPWLAEALRAPGMHVSEPFASPVSGERVSMLSYPLRGGARVALV